MLSNLFNYVVGALTIISAIIVITPFFPQYKTAVRLATVFFLGTLVGSLFASAQGQAIIFQFEGGLFQVTVLAACIFCVAILLIMVISIALGGEVKESHREAVGWALGLFILFTVLYGIANYNNPLTKPSAERHFSGRDADELLSLARYYKAQGNNNIALEYYGRALGAVYQDQQKTLIKKEMDTLLIEKK